MYIYNNSFSITTVDMILCKHLLGEKKKMKILVGKFNVNVNLGFLHTPWGR